MKLCMKVLPLEDIEDVLDVILQLIRIHNGRCRNFREILVLANKDDKISHLGNHNQDLLIQIKKIKNENKTQWKIKKQLIDKEIFTDSVESATLAEVKVHTINRETLIEKIGVEMSSVINDENLSIVEYVKPSIDKAILKDPIIVEDPFAIDDEKLWLSLIVLTHQ